MVTLPDYDEMFTGEFVTDIAVMRNKFRNIKAFVFDWDGVFNNGHKDVQGQSTFSEIDSMGINLLRFNTYLFRKQMPITAVFTGENNEVAYAFAKRENFNNVYFKVMHKELALKHFCQQHNLTINEVMYVYDDVLDFSVAKLVALRMMVGRKSNPLTIEFAKHQRLVDYITQHDGGHNAIREVTELCLLLSNSFHKVMELRMKFAEDYQQYIALRKTVNPTFFTLQNNQIVTP
ncbi:MAG: hypothetical protein RLY16_811 [Bacteroidota bacterium]|jgi:3-deoxy-D-manno-octulosonate 8-phosphate phosphatase (KDO 8-P phosphatase)